MYTRVRDGGGVRGWTGGVDHCRRRWRIRGGFFGGDGWDVHIPVACILACFIIAASTPVLLVLYIFKKLKVTWGRQILHF